MMMTEQQAIELGRRAVASRHWRWLPGMRDMNIGARALLRPSGSGVEWIVDGHPSITPLQNGMVPDMRDACTRGGLLELVRLAWCDPHLAAVRSRRGAGSPASSIPPGAERTSSGGWEMMRWSLCRDSLCRPARGGWHESEAEALVAALEAAP